MIKCRAILIAFSFIALFACNKKEPELYWQVIRTGRQQVYYQPLKIISQQNDTSAIVNYFSPFDSLTYIFGLKSPVKAKNISLYEGDKDGVFKLVHTHTVKVNNRQYNINQYSTADGTIDAGSEHYWTEELGFFFIRASSWPNYYVLQSTDEEKSREIWKLVKILHPEIKGDFKFVGITEGKEHIIQKHHKVIPKDYKL